MTISQEDARRAIELLTKVSDRSAGFAVNLVDGQLVVTLDDEIAEFLYDDAGYSRFEERDDDPSPMCRCEECPSGGPWTCISHD